MPRRFLAALLILLVAEAGSSWGQSAPDARNRLYLSPPGSQPIPSTQVPELARQLLQEARQLGPNLRFELAGTAQGRRAEVAANALLGATEAFEAQVRTRFMDPTQLRPSFGAVERAHSQLQGEMNNPPGTAPQSGWIARRIDRLVFELGRVITGGGVTLTPLPTLPQFGYDPAQLVRLCDMLEADLGLLRDRIWHELGSVGPHNAISRDLEGLLAQVQQFHVLASQAVPRSALQAAWQPVRNTVRALGANLEGGRLPGRFRNDWRAIRQDSDRITATLGLSLDFVVEPDQPVIINPPVYPNLPYPVYPSTAGRPLPGTLCNLVDQALGEVDAFLLGIQPNLLVVPEGPRFQADAREVRNELLRLRQAALNPYDPRTLQVVFRRVETDYRRLRERTDRIARGRFGPNIERIDRLGDLLVQIRQQLQPI